MKKQATLKMQDIEIVNVGRNKARVQNFSDLVGETEAYRFDEMDGQTVYICKVEPMFSDTFGEGWRVTWREMPDAKDSYECRVFGSTPGQQIKALYQATNEGKRIDAFKGVKAVIRKAGKTYRFE